MKVKKILALILITAMLSSLVLTINVFAEDEDIQPVLISAVSMLEEPIYNSIEGEVIAVNLVGENQVLTVAGADGTLWNVIVTDSTYSIVLTEAEVEEETEAAPEDEEETEAALEEETTEAVGEETEAAAGNDEEADKAAAEAVAAGDDAEEADAEEADAEETTEEVTEAESEEEVEAVETIANIGDNVKVYYVYDSKSPMLMIYPQYIIANFIFVNVEENVVIAKFDEKLVALDGSLKLQNIEEEVEETEAAPEEDAVTDDEADAEAEVETTESVPEETTEAVTDAVIETEAGDEGEADETTEAEAVAEPAIEIFMANGAAFEGELADLAGKGLIVIYAAATDSLPPMPVAPYTIIVLEEKAVAPIYELTVEEATIMYAAFDEALANAEIIINGVALDAPKAFRNEEGILMVPVRAISEAMGFAVEWVDETKTVIIGEGLLTFSIGINSYNLGGLVSMPSKAAPVLVEDRTFVPINLFELIGNLGVAEVDYYFTSDAECGKIVVEVKIPEAPEAPEEAEEPADDESDADGEEETTEAAPAESDEPAEDDGETEGEGEADAE